MAKVTFSSIIKAVEDNKKQEPFFTSIDIMHNNGDKAVIKELQYKSQKLLECTELINNMAAALECLENNYDNIEVGYFEYLCNCFESTLNECFFSKKEQEKIESAKEIITWVSSIEKVITSLKFSYNELLAKEEKLAESMEIRQIEFGDFVVLSNVFKCNKNHNIETVQANISIITPSGTVERLLVSAGYCQQCKIYFILETDYIQAKNKGILLCRQITRDVYERCGDELFDGTKLNVESLLHQIGYNVNAQDNLTSKQRQKLLKLAIDNNLYSTSGLLSFLDWLIARNKKVSNRDMSQAISKWAEDRIFVANYKLDSQRKVEIASLTAPNSDLPF